jgi:ferredoxin
MDRIKIMYRINNEIYGKYPSRSQYTGAATRIGETVMAELIIRLSVNAPGKFYVDSSCIDCDLCRQRAPDTFARDDEIALSYAYRQPETPAELAAALVAAEDCPTSSIGSDGDRNEDDVWDGM